MWRSFPKERQRSSRNSANYRERGVSITPYLIRPLEGLPGARAGQDGRPITAGEFERTLEATAKVRPQDTEIWRHYLWGLWLSGLRLEESLVFSWDDDSPFAADLSGRYVRSRSYLQSGSTARTCQ